MLKRTVSTPRLASLSVLLLLGLSCDKSPTQNDEHRFSLTEANYHQIAVVLTDYDKIHITHRLGDLAVSTVFSSILIGTTDSLGFHESAGILLTLNASTGEFSGRLDATITVDSTVLEVPLTLVFIRPNRSQVSVDTTVPMYRYPFDGARIFVTSKIAPYPEHFQDIDWYGGNFYYLGMADAGTFRFTPGASQTQRLFMSPGGNHIAVDSGFLFYDFNNGINRYTLANANVTQVINSLPGRYVGGLDVENGFLWVYFAETSNARYIIRYTLAGVPLDTTTFPHNSYYMTLHDGKLYTVETPNGLSQPHVISRFDIVAKSFQTTLRGPARYLDGITIYRDTLYYCDYFRKAVGRIALADFN